MPLAASLQYEIAFHFARECLVHIAISPPFFVCIISSSKATTTGFHRSLLISHNSSYLNPRSSHFHSVHQCGRHRYTQKFGNRVEFIGISDKLDIKPISKIASTCLRNLCTCFCATNACLLDPSALKGAHILSDRIGSSRVLLFYSIARQITPSDRSLRDIPKRVAHLICGQQL